MKINEVGEKHSQQCDPGFVNEVIRPRLMWVLEDNLKTNTLEKLTGTTSFIRSYLEDTCSGQLSGRTALRLLRATLHTGANAVVLTATVISSVAGFLISGPLTALGIGVLGLMIALRIVPKLAEKFTLSLVSFGKNLIKDVGEYARSIFPNRDR